MNGDGSIDVLSASSEDHKIAWYESEVINGNDGGSATSGDDAIAVKIGVCVVLGGVGVTVVAVSVFKFLKNGKNSQVGST